MTSFSQALLKLADQNAILSKIKQDDILLLIIKHPLFDAVFSYQGAQLLHWQPKSSTSPVIWLSEKTAFKSKVAIRGGVPICWPWFGNAGNPSHGFARNELWQLDETVVTDKNVKCVFSLTKTEATLAHFPHDFKIYLIAELGETCKLTFKAECAAESTIALHSYFAVDDIEKTQVSGLGDRYYDKLASENIPAVSGVMTFVKEVDRIYQSPETEQIIRDGNRRLVLTHKNVTDVVVWNPWIEKAKSVQDLTDDSYQQFVCVESAKLQQPLTDKLNQTGQIELTIHIDY